MAEPTHTSLWRHLFRTPHRLHWVNASGVRTRVLEAGPDDGPPLLLLHGTAGSLENFGANIATYAQHFRVLAIDLMGCGWTDRPTQDVRIPDYARHVRDVMDALQIASAQVIGVSLGSWIGAWLALTEPARVQRLVMVAPAGIVTDPEREARFAEGVRQRRSQAAQAPSWDSVSAAMRGLVLDPASLSDELIALRLDIYRDLGLQQAMPHLLAFTLGGQALSREQWQSLTQPLLLIAAVDAPNMFLDNARAIAELAPKAELVELKGCDHWAQYEQAEAFHAVTLPFLQGPCA